MTTLMLAIEVPPKSIMIALYERNPKSRVIAHTIYIECQRFQQIILDDHISMVLFMKTLCNSPYQLIYQYDEKNKINSIFLYIKCI